jgi:hypothetical protein
MNISNTTSGPALNGLLTSSYLHPAGGMTDQNDAAPMCLLLLHVDNGPAIMATTHEPNLFKFFVQNDTINTISRLLLPCDFECSAIQQKVSCYFAFFCFIVFIQARQL